MAADESPRTTKLYDHTGYEITVDEVERITIQWNKIWHFTHLMSAHLDESTIMSTVRR